jgi:hypothetical protein
VVVVEKDKEEVAKKGDEMGILGDTNLFFLRRTISVLTTL